MGGIGSAQLKGKDPIFLFTVRYMFIFEFGKLLLWDQNLNKVSTQYSLPLRKVCLKFIPSPNVTFEINLDHIHIELRPTLGLPCEVYHGKWPTGVFQKEFGGMFILIVLQTPVQVGLLIGRAFEII